MGHVRAASLRGDLSFLASDLLEGRDTPSRGLDIAAEYIAAQFRRSGLEPGGDQGFYQTARMIVREDNFEGFELKLSRGDRTLSANPKDVALDVAGALELASVPIFKLDLTGSALDSELSAEQMNGKVVIVGARRPAGGNARAVFEKLRDAKPAALIIIRSRATEEQAAGKRLIDPETPPEGPPRLTITGDAAIRFYESLKAGLTDAVASIHVAAPHETQVTLRNVIGVLRGSDPSLKDSCLLLTAHYDHIGRLPDGPGDRIFNGANDDASGTVSVIEVARAFAALERRPRRSVVFALFFGEEEGMFGSHYYARHPAWPLEKTDAQLNLEQVGRTDSNEGAQISRATLTGFDYSDLAEYLARSGAIAGIKLYKHPRNSDLYFRLSDNLPLAQAGVPAHTLAVTFEYPDYHGLGDDWSKIDYDNMAKVDRMIAGALWMMAESEAPIHWKETNPKTAPFLKARKATQR